eukprot:TRINITY_DN18231_c0_g1_i1.p1 TRINITY_DN18231_c0_g1~~TRINITY_DN18231_c0_g1_i1.p1  ORF type:complete len:155 (+),score=30.83 TRINITY_DN18231_c0_g1_i1:51-515(+)
MRGLLGYVFILLVNMDNRFCLIQAQYPAAPHNNQREVFLPRIRLLRPQESFKGMTHPNREAAIRAIPQRTFYPSNEVLGETFEYDEFPEIPPFLEMYSGVRNEIDGETRKSGGLRRPHQKRYLGIDIPDYISNGGKENAIKDMSNKMKAVGKRK